jgi:hypothetical protein
MNPYQEVRINEATRSIDYETSPEWNALYTSWNLAFITSQLPNMNLFYPKLFIPHVINAEPEKFLFQRALALWTTLNFHLLSVLHDKPSVEFPEHTKIAERWGEVNLKYAKAYAKQFNHIEFDTYGDLLKLPLNRIIDKIGTKNNLPMKDDSY